MQTYIYFLNSVSFILKFVDHMYFIIFLSGIYTIFMIGLSYLFFDTVHVKRKYCTNLYLFLKFRDFLFDSICYHQPAKPIRHKLNMKSSLYCSNCACLHFGCVLCCVFEIDSQKLRTLILSQLIEKLLETQQAFFVVS